LASAGVCISYSIDAALKRVAPAIGAASTSDGEGESPPLYCEFFGRPSE